MALCKPAGGGAEKPWRRGEALAPGPRLLRGQPVRRRMPACGSRSTPRHRRQRLHARHPRRAPQGSAQARVDPRRLRAHHRRDRSRRRGADRAAAGRPDDLRRPAPARDARRTSPTCAAAPCSSITRAPPRRSPRARNTRRSSPARTASSSAATIPRSARKKSPRQSPRPECGRWRENCLFTAPASSPLAVRIRRVAHGVAGEVERENGQDDEQHRGEQATGSSRRSADSGSPAASRPS
jgi:hypothetical protein